MIDLGTLGGSNSAGTAINNAGEVTGYSHTENCCENHAFLWNDNRMIDLSPEDTVGSSGVDINGRGHELIHASKLGPLEGFTHPHRFDRAFFWDGAAIIDLGTLGTRTDSVPRDLNDADQVTGDSWRTTTLRTKSLPR
jgi:probable HAF family extracellular repeat protein